MSDTDMEHGEHAVSSTATPKLYISDRTSDTPGAIELELEILPAFNLRSTEVVLVELFINGNTRGQRLIQGLSSDQKATFTVPNRYWRADERSASIVYKACLHITRGSLIRQATSVSTSLTKIEGKTYKVSHRLANQNLHEDDSAGNNDISERSKAEASDYESSQEEFYDARSQFEDTPGTFPAEEEPIVEDAAAAEGGSPANNQRNPISGETGKSTSITLSSTEDDLARLGRAKRDIFQKDDSPSMEPVTAPSRSPVNASSQTVQDPDTEMFDDLASNATQSEDDNMTPLQKKPMQTFGTIDGFLSSSKTAAQHDINNHNIDPDDEAENLVHNRKPLRRTSFAPAGSAMQSDISITSIGNGKAKEDSLNGKEDSDTEEDETGATVPSSKTRKDPAKQKAYHADRAASGARVNTELRKRLADNDKKIGVKGAVLKLWKGKNAGKNSNLKVANLRLKDILEKQGKLHNLLSACTDAYAASELRRRLKPWAKGDQIDVYESQLDAIFTIVQNAPSKHLTSTKQQANEDPGVDSDDYFPLPLMSSQQQKMAAALLPGNPPMRKTTDAQPRESAACHQQVQPSTSHTMVSRVNDTPEDSDDNELPPVNDLLTLRLPKESLTKTQLLRNADNSAERPKKKPRME